MAEAEQDGAVLPPRGASIPAEIGENFCLTLLSTLHIWYYIVCITKQ